MSNTVVERYRARRHRSFEKLTPAQQRVAIAKDVLSQMAAQKFIPTNGYGTYFPGDQSCRGCALGGIFFSRFNGEIASSDSDRMREKLAPYFSMQQLKLIECAYEMWIGEWKNEIGGSFQPIGYSKFSPPSDHTPRLTNILNNIIRNKGTFVPEQYPFMKWVPSATEAVVGS